MTGDINEVGASPEAVVPLEADCTTQLAVLEICQKCRRLVEKGETPREARRKGKSALKQCETLCKELPKTATGGAPEKAAENTALRYRLYGGLRDALRNLYLAIAGAAEIEEEIKSLRQTCADRANLLEREAKSYLRQKWCQEHDCCIHGVPRSAEDCDEEREARSCSRVARQKEA